VARREARALYGLALVRIRRDCLVEGMHLLEEAIDLDPEAAPLHKALIPIYLALGRVDEALAACRKTLDLDPGDADTWSLYGRQLKNRGKLTEARTALERALSCQELNEHPDRRVQIQYELGQLAEQTQAYDQAITAFGGVIQALERPQAALDLGTSEEKLKEQAATTYERLIRLCIQARQYDRALTYFGEAQAKYPSLAPRLNYQLAKVHAARGQWNEALACLDSYMVTQPLSTEPYELRLTLLQKLGRNLEILSSLAEYAERDSHNVGLHLLLAREYARAGEAQEAEAIYTKLADQAPSAEVYRGLFGLYRDQQAMHKALVLLEEALGAKDGHGEPVAAAKGRAMLQALREDASLARAIVPAGQQALQRNERLQQQTMMLLAVLADRTRQLPQAEAFYRRCLETGTVPEPIVYQGLLEVLWKGNKYEAIVELCQDGLRRSQATNHLLFRNSLSRALAFLGKMEEAMAEADKLVSIASEDQRLSTRLTRMWVLGQAERYAQALAEADALQKEYTRPDEVRRIRYGLYNIYTANGDLAKAEAQLLSLLKSDPEDATANNDLGYLWADQGRNLDEAERLIRRAIGLDRQQKKMDAALLVSDDEESAAYLDSLGWVLFRRGRLQDARAWLEKASGFSGAASDPTIWDHLGDVYFRLQDTARAGDAWRKAVGLFEAGKQRRLDDHYKELKRKLHWLEETTRRP
jgi:tetratricopeptide (TPR) repeat protein